jgi:hypothetical protein
MPVRRGRGRHQRGGHDELEQGGASGEAPAVVALEIEPYQGSARCAKRTWM